MRAFGHLRANHETGELKPSPVRAVTRSPLGHAFGADHKRRLVVTLAAADMIELRPLGTRRPSALVTLKAAEVYRFGLSIVANRALLERARAAKQRKAIRLAQARQYRAERRLFEEHTQ